MKIDLLRHGEALAVADVVSGERPLTDRGLADLERLGRRLRDEGWRPDGVRASPLLRARQSVEALLRAARIETVFTVLPALDPSRGSVTSVLESLRDEEPAAHLLLVGHQPLLGELVHRLCGRSVPFATAALVRIESGAAPARGSGRIVLALEPGRDF